MCLAESRTMPSLRACSSNSSPTHEQLLCAIENVDALVMMSGWQTQLVTWSLVDSTNKTVVDCIESSTCSHLAAGIILLGLLSMNLGATLGFISSYELQLVLFDVVLCGCWSATLRQDKEKNEVAFQRLHPSPHLPFAGQWRWLPGTPAANGLLGSKFQREVSVASPLQAFFLSLSPSLPSLPSLFK